MIPFATPENRNVINLLQIVRVVQGAPGTKDEGITTVHFVNGDIITYSGEAAKIINIEVSFALNAYRALQQASQRQIITPETAAIM